MEVEPNSTTFVYEGVANTVILRGEWNQWQDQPMTKIRDNHWEISISGIKVGVIFQYGFSIDGIWTKDHNRFFKGPNSILLLPEVYFEFQHTPSSFGSVSLAGLFNVWKTRQEMFYQGGVWKRAFKLPVGLHFFKFVVSQDGQDKWETSDKYLVDGENNYIMLAEERNDFIWAESKTKNVKNQTVQTEIPNFMVEYTIQLKSTGHIRRVDFQSFGNYLRTRGFKNGEGKVAIVTLAIAGRIEQYFDKPLGDKEIPIVIQRNKNFSSPVDKLSDPFDGRMIVVYFDEDKFQFRSPEDEQNLKSQLLAN
eukprot:TRINITY_DN696_c0_g1_i2.p1 TRINITY_DN696_c0_g1~~TRINITY_DN696_c0_g1_i2.p1  ORF type:complete len:307 (-),score=64.92 TRINITY_DN696_c0_g1_i2:62-982(-)